MKAVVVSSVALGVVALIGVGIVFTRFIVKNDEEKTVNNEISGEMIGNTATNDTDSNFDFSNILGDNKQAIPQQNKPQNTMLDANSEALAAQQAVSACMAIASKKIHVKDWSNLGSVNAVAQGDDCYNSIVRISIKSSDGKTLFSMSAPARDFGISETSDSNALTAALSASLPDSAIRAAAYPEWDDEDNETPYGTEFSRDAYQKIRDKNAPVICVKVPSAPQTCVAYDSTSDKLKTFQRG